MTFLAWNVRGLNKTRKQKDIISILRSNGSGLICLLEHKIKENKEKKVKERMFKDWGSYYNNNFGNEGHMWLTWNRLRYKVDIMEAGNQWIHCSVEDLINPRSYLATFVYAYNDREERRELWEAPNRFS